MFTKQIAVLIFNLLICFNSCLCKTKTNFIDPMRHETILVTPITLNSQLSQQRNHWGVSVLLQFSSKQQKNNVYIEKTYDVVAKKLRGLVRFLAIDCAEWRKFCQETYNKNLEYPFVLVYSSDILLPPETLPKAPTENQITHAALKYITSRHIEELTKDNLDEFLHKNEAIPKIILFSTKKTPPVIIKALSNAFADRVSFGYVQPHDKFLQKKYNIKKLPSIILQKSSLAEIERYSGNMTYLDLHNWVNVHAETFVKGGGYSETNKKNDASKIWLKAKVPELTLESHKDICFKKDLNFCMIYIKNGTLSENERSMLQNLANNNSVIENGRIKLKWAWLNLNIEKNFIELIKKDFSGATVIALNTRKRLRYTEISQKSPPNHENIKDFIENIVSGNSKFTPIKSQELPQFIERSTITTSDEL